VTPGDSFTITYTVENTGTTELASLGLQATDVTSGLTITDVTTQDGFAPGQNTVAFQTVEPGETATAEFTVQVDSNASGDLSLTAEASNGFGESEITRASTTVVSAVPTNQPPTVDAGSDQTVSGGDEVQLNASSSSDPDGDTLSYEWTQLTGPDVTLLVNESATPTFTAPDVDEDTTLSFEVEASDGNGGSDTDTVNVTVIGNAQPTADAGPDQEVNETTEVQLDASGSSDPDGDVVTYSWEQVAGPSVALADNSTATPSFTAPNVSADTTLTFEVTTRDGNGGTDTDVVNVTVVPTNDAPVADAGLDQTVNATDTVQLDGTGSSDPNNDDLNYTWSQVAGPSVDLSNSESATPTFAAPDLDTPIEVVFELQVSDGELTDTDAVNVTVEPVLAPTNFSVSDLSAPASVTQGDQVTVTANVTNIGDLEGTQTVDFRLDTDGSGTLDESESLANRTVTLASDESQTVEFEVPTEGLDTGTYLHGVVTENDTQTAQLDVTTVTPPASFSVSDLSAPSTVTQGDNVTVTANVTNTGGLEGTQDIAFRLDTDGDGTLDESETLANETATLSSGETISVEFDVSTDGLDTGTYLHGVVTANESQTAEITVEQVPPANFSVSNLSAPASVTQADSVTVTADVTNTGALEGTQSVDFRLDTDGSGTLDESEVLATETVTLAGGESQSVAFEVSTESLDAGTYLHGVVTANDSQTAQLEVTEVTSPASFSVSNLDAPSTVTRGESVTVTASITNTGGLEGTQDIAFRLDTDGDGTLEDDETLADETVTLDTGATQSVTFEVPTDSLESGTYLHGVVTDNDTQTAQLEVTEPTPANFSVTTLSAPTSAVQGENVTVTVGVTNTGDQAGRQTVDLRVDANSDGTLDADETVATRTVGLGPGDSIEETIDVSTEDLSAGTFTYGLVIDNDTRTEEFTLVPPSASANFSVTDLSAPASVTQGSTVTVTATVTNVGSQAGTQTVDFRLDDGSGALAADETLASQSVSLASSESQSVEFEVSSDGLEIGTYRHGVVTDNDSQTAQIEVESTSTPTPEPSQPSDDSPPDFSSDLTEQSNGAVVEFSDATANRRYSVDLGDSIQSNDVTVTGTEMFFDRNVNDGTIEFSASGSAPDDAQELAGSLTYLSVETDDVSDDDLVEVEIEFTVPLSALDEQDIDPEDVQLYRFEDGQWVAYETSHEGDGEFMADEIPGYSVFAIGPAGATEAAAQQTATATPEPTATPTPDPTETATPEPTETETPEPTETETETAAPEPTDTTTPAAAQTTSTQFPGFTPALAVIALIVAALLARRRLEGDR
jgi:PGF-pre-PGF domain-containing protein/PGF-CTERM protein